MVVAFLFIGLAFFIFLINTTLFRSVYNYANAFTFIWCFCAGMSGLGLYGFYIPPIEAYLYIALMLVTFEISTCFCKKVRIGRPKINKKKNISISWWVINAISIVCMVIMVPIMILSLRRLMTDGMNVVRNLMLHNKLISTAQSLMLERIIQPIIIANIVITLYDFVEKKKIRLPLILSLANVIIFTAIYANRWLVMEVLYIIIVIMMIKYRSRMVSMFKENKRLILIGIVLVLIMAYVTSQRQIRGSKSLVYNIYSYFIGSIHLFGVSISEPGTFLLHDTGNMLYGSVLFSSLFGIVDLISLFLRGVNAPVLPGISVINEVVQQFYYVSPTTHMNNNVTMIYGFLRDGGVIGVIIDTFILALFLCSLYKKRNNSNFRMSMYIFALSMFPSLIFEWMLGRTYIILVFMVLWGYEKLFAHSKKRV